MYSSWYLVPLLVDVAVVLSSCAGHGSNPDVGARDGRMPTSMCSVCKSVKWGDEDCGRH